MFSIKILRNILSEKEQETLTRPSLKTYYRNRLNQSYVNEI